MTVLSERWVSDNSGLLSRRGRSNRIAGGGHVLHEPDLNTLPLGALSHPNMVNVLFGDPAYGDVSSQRARMSIVDTDRGHAVRWTTTASNISQVAFQPVLPEICQRATMEYWIRFVAGFPWGVGIGGKQPGLGGTRVPITKTPPSGGSTDGDGFGARHMFNGDNVGGQLATNDEWTFYVYDHDTSGVGYHGPAGLGGPVALGASGGVSTGEWHHVKQEIGMNTVTVEGNASPPADGIFKEWFDGVLRYDQPWAWRKYSNVGITHIQWSQFFGGDVTWAPTTGPHYVDITGLKIVKLV